MTLWECLGIQRGCSNEDLKAAYRRKCLELHPDKTGNDPNKTKLFVSMKTVYEKVVAQRELYGIESPLPPPQARPAPRAPSYSDIFSTAEKINILKEMMREKGINFDSGYGHPDYTNIDGFLKKKPRGSK